MKNLVKTAVISAALFGVAVNASASGNNYNGTEAGKDIVNKAVASYTLSGNDNSVTSNEVTVTVQEVIDVAVSSDPTTTVDAGGIGEQLEYTVTNTGNGTENFKITYTAGSGGFTPTNIVLFVDKDNDGNIGVGEELTNGDTIELQKGESAKVIIRANIPAGQAAGSESPFSLTAASDTQGAADADRGDILTGKGTGGASDAIVGDSPKATASAKFVVGSVFNAVSISKSLTKSLDPFGNDTNIPGTVVTYTITVTTDTTNGTIENLVITDELPAELTYDTNPNLPADERGSVTLNDVGQTEADDATDNTKVVGNTVTVDLGDVATGRTDRIVITATIK